MVKVLIEINFFIFHYSFGNTNWNLYMYITFCLVKPGNFLRTLEKNRNVANLFRLRSGLNSGGDSSVRYEGIEGDAIEIKEPEDAKQHAEAENDANNGTFTVDDAVEQLGFGKFQLKLSFLTGLAWVSEILLAVLCCTVN